MLLSAPIYKLKRRARLLAREAGIPLNQALDRIAAEEGYRGWSQLAARAAAEGPAGRIYARLRPGDLLLLAARPGQGKTLLGLELLLEAAKAGRRAVFFTLEYSQREVTEKLRGLGAAPGSIEVDSSDAICAEHIAGRLAGAAEGTLAVIDYLQLLDQKRCTPPLAEQAARLKAFAAGSGAILICLSQIDRGYDATTKALPDVTDLRLPNPLDLGLFSKACFLNDGKLRFESLAGS
mgnify:CR=1 FL=1